MMVSSGAMKIRPEPIVGTPRARASRSCGRKAAMIFARSSGGMCSASSIVMDTTARSGDGSSRKRSTTDDRPFSGVKVT